jgi:hypothetical protein
MSVFVQHIGAVIPLSHFWKGFLKGAILPKLVATLDLSVQALLQDFGLSLQVISSTPRRQSDC